MTEIWKPIVGFESLYEVSRGESHPAAKITVGNVQEIRHEAAAGVMHKDLAARFGIGRKAITKIVNYQRWKHVE